MCFYSDFIKDMQNYVHYIREVLTNGKLSRNYNPQLIHTGIAVHMDALQPGNLSRINNFLSIRFIQFQKQFFKILFIVNSEREAKIKYISTKYAF